MKEFWERLKAMPTWQKLLLFVGLVAVVGIALYIRQKNAASANATPATAGITNGAYDVYGNPMLGGQTPGDLNYATGPQGPQGPTGPAGATGYTTTTTGKETLDALVSYYGGSTARIIDWNKAKYPQIATISPKSPLPAGWTLRVY